MRCAASPPSADNDRPENMNPDDKWSFRKSFKDTARRVKGVFEPPSPQPSSSTSNLPSHTPSAQILHNASPSVNPPFRTPLPTVSAISQDGPNTLHTPPARPLSATNITSPSRANVPPSANPPSPPTTVASALGNVKDTGSVAWVGLGSALRVLKESSDVFPPLKSAVSGLLACLDVLQVNTWDSIINGLLNHCLCLGSG
jgi:hypothetical protein